MLSPGQTKGTTYQISNPQDLGTPYFVQCVVRNSLSLSIISTINLKSQGNGLYTGSYFVPQDSSGVGYELFETVSVYTDSGYTQLSPNYSIVNTPYEVKFQLSAGTFGGANAGGYQPDLTDYKIIRDIVIEELAELAKNIKPKDFDTKHLEEGMRRLVNGLTAGMKIHREEMVKLFGTHKSETSKSLEELGKSIFSVGKSVNGIPLAEAVEQIMGGLAEVKGMHLKLGQSLGEISESQGKSYEDFGKRHEELKSEMQNRFDNHLKETRDTLADYFSSVDTLVVNKGLPRPERKEVAYDFLSDVDKYGLFKPKTK